MQATNKTIISHNDRFGLTLFLAITVHALIILGITFTVEDNDDGDIITSMDITLVQHQSETKPDKADYLAQADQQGSGNTTEKVKHKAVQSRPSPDKTNGDAEVNTQAAKKSPNQSASAEILHRKDATRIMHSDKKEPDTKPVKNLSTEDLVRRSKELARLSAQNDADWQAYSQRPDSKYLYANTKRHVDAAYLAAWTRKVKKIGNMNYPRKNKSGNLIIEVTLNPNGSLISTRVLKSSNHHVLDKAALDIVKLAAPFAPIPKDVLQDRKVLRIVRTWVFTTDNRLDSN